MLGVSTLSSGAKQVTDSFEKAEILNSQFHSVFTNENLSNIPTPESLHPSMPDISFFTEGIFKLLCELDVTKSPGPDAIPSIVLRHCAAQFSRSFLLNQCQLESSWGLAYRLQVLHQFLRRMTGAIHLIIVPSPLPQFVAKSWSISFTTQSWNILNNTRY